jgi:ABC-type Zn uptake system ZnuABC Zn-binding protein ZnuA
MPSIRRRLVLCACLCTCLLTGCAVSAPAPQATPEPGLLLSASHYPAYLAALQIAGDVPGVRVETFLQPQGGYLEDFRLSELDWARAQRADILVMIGGGLEDFLTLFAAEGGKPVLAAGEHVPRIPGRVLDSDEEPTPAENPYTWLSPKRWGRIVDGVAAGLAQLDPERAPAYIAADNAALPRVEAMADRLRDAMLPYLGRRVIVMHPALAYLAEDAGLDVVHTLWRDPSVQPTSADLEELLAQLAPYPDAVLLLEQSAPLSLRDLGGRRTALCDVLCQGPLPGDPAVWERAMQGNIAALEAALSGR